MQNQTSSRFHLLAGVIHIHGRRPLGRLSRRIFAGRRLLVLLSVVATILGCALKCARSGVGYNKHIRWSRRATSERPPRSTARPAAAPRCRGAAAAARGTRTGEARSPTTCSWRSSSRAASEASSRWARRVRMCRPTQRFAVLVGGSEQHRESRSRGGGTVRLWSRSRTAEDARRHRLNGIGDANYYLWARAKWCAREVGLTIYVTVFGGAPAVLRAPM